MTSTTAVTVNRSREEVERLWSSSTYRPEYIQASDAAAVSFRDAPGDRGTEIHVDLSAGTLARIVQGLSGHPPLARVKDDLRRFKQQLETGEIARSDGAPEGELAERRLKQRPAQPLEASELEKAGAR